MTSGYEIRKIQLKTTNFKKIMKCFKPLLRFLGPKQNLGRALLLGGVHCYLGRALLLGVCIVTWGVHCDIIKGFKTFLRLLGPKQDLDVIYPCVSHPAILIRENIRPEKR